jgi:D-lactate dehydrogenase (cytochrome)
LFRHKGRSGLRVISGRREIEQSAADLLRDESNLAGAWCEEAAWPENAREAADSVSASAARGGVTISGGRTGIVAGALPAGGTVLSTAALLGVSPGRAPGTLRVGAGVPLADFRAIAAGWGSGMFFPPDPTEETATLGGMAATDASGSDSYLYGSTRNWIDGIEAVLSGGRILDLRRGDYSFDESGTCHHPEIGRLRIDPGNRALPKDAAGYWIRPGMDLIDLLLGSEGTLCLITSVEVRLAPCPEQTLSIAAFPDSPEAAWSLLAALRSARCRMRALEIMDADCLSFLRKHPADGVPVPPEGARAALVFRIEASAAGLDSAMDEIWTLLSSAGVPDDAVWGGTEAPEQRRIRAFRHSLPEAVNAEIAARKRLVPGIHKLGSDSAVAAHLLPGFYSAIIRILGEKGLEHLVFGHSGQGHLHANVLPGTPEELTAGEAAMDEIARAAVELGGTVSAEHGLGRLKAHQLKIMYGDRERRAMRLLRQAIDPDGVFAPAIPWP